MMSRAAYADYNRSEAQKKGFERLEYPEFTINPVLDTGYLIGRAKTLEKTAQDEKLSLRLASVLARAGRKEEAVEILDAAFERSAKHARTGSNFDQQHRAAKLALAYIPAYAECGELERATQLTNECKNKGFLSEFARLQAHALLARGEYLYGNKDTAREILNKIIDGKAGHEGIETFHRTNETALSLVVNIALEVGEFDIASRAALARNPKDDIYQRTAGYLRGAVAATLLVAGETKKAEAMFERTLEGPETSIRRETMEHCELAARIELNDASWVKKVKFPDRRYGTIDERTNDMIGVSLVNFHERRKDWAGMTEAAQKLSEAGYTDSAFRPFDLHMKAGRLLEAMDYLCVMESAQLLHHQEKLWHRLLVAGARADFNAVFKLASGRVVENADSGRLLGADGTLWSLHVTPLAQTYLELGDIKAAEKVTAKGFLHEASDKTTADALGSAVVGVLEGRFPEKEPTHRAFPICWLSMRD